MNNKNKNKVLASEVNKIIIKRDKIIISCVKVKVSIHLNLLYFSKFYNYIWSYFLLKSKQFCCRIHIQILYLVVKIYDSWILMLIAVVYLLCELKKFKSSKKWMRKKKLWNAKEEEEDEKKNSQSNKKKQCKEQLRF